MTAFSFDTRPSSEKRQRFTSNFLLKKIPFVFHSHSYHCTDNQKKWRIRNMWQTVNQITTITLKWIAFLCVGWLVGVFPILSNEKYTKRNILLLFFFFSADRFNFNLKCLFFQVTHCSPLRPFRTTNYTCYVRLNSFVNKMYFYFRCNNVMRCIALWFNEINIK